MLPHERSLVQRLADQPFALLGINSDDPTELPELLTKHQVTWRNAVEGSTDGPIARAWNVSGWPTIYVLDHKGVIRFRDVRDEDMSAAVDQLLRALKAEAPRAGD